MTFFVKNQNESIFGQSIWQKSVQWKLSIHILAKKIPRILYVTMDHLYKVSYERENELPVHFSQVPLSIIIFVERPSLNNGFGINSLLKTQLQVHYNIEKHIFYSFFIKCSLLEFESKFNQM